jgi:hypothetical protein
MNSAPNVTTSTNQLDMGTWVAAAPAAARSTNPEAMATRSTTAMCFQTAL